MSFTSQFRKRLSALEEREPQTFPEHLFPREYSRAAVLLLFWPGPDDAVELVLTKRTETVSSHRGQVSFPGGVFHAGDGDLAATALRETQEELGIDPDVVTIMGRLDDAWSIAGHHVIPYVGWTRKAPEMQANSHEVAEVIVADVRVLLRPEVNTIHTVDFLDKPRTTLAFDWDGGYVWGLTADMLREFLNWLNDEPCDRFERRLKKMDDLPGMQSR
ncbi:MAG: CoA pyrophosphatase [Gammaproteobacteria bacterium]|nr:CoA pyrophosphatase [Gammaproteobacteria bacterium]